MTKSAPVGGVAAAVLALALAVLMSPARAQDCKAGKTQADLDACAGEGFARADGALNVTYKNVLDRLRDERATRTLLVAAQNAWLGFRDGECAFESAATIGGSIHSMIVTECRTSLTKARTDALRRLLTCGEGDMSCPLPPR